MKSPLYRHVIGTPNQKHICICQSYVSISQNLKSLYSAGNYAVISFPNLKFIHSHCNFLLITTLIIIKSLWRCKQHMYVHIYECMYIYVCVYIYILKAYLRIVVMFIYCFNLI